MHLETRSRTAARLVSEAVADLAAFRSGQDRDWLLRATQKLEIAQREDPEYLSAAYYRAIADDLNGRATEAIPQLTKVLEQKPPFCDEAEFHLGLAYYHRYNRPSLERAVAHFSAVAERTNDQALRIRSQVALLQALGMRMVPSEPAAADLNEIERSYQLLREESTRLERSLHGSDPSGETQAARASLLNARAIGAMYWSDFCGTVSEKVETLRNAIENLTQADALNPNSWLTQCNLGSAWMRLGIWAKSPEYFEQGRRSLHYVVALLRPEYGFALYELGRIDRLTGRFTQAVEFFERVRAIPYDYRDVSDRRLDLEQRRAETRSLEYP